MNKEKELGYQVRSFERRFEVRAEGEKLKIEGYFAVFGDKYEMWPGAVEEIAPGAFATTIKSDDIRALINHDTTLVLGRNTAGTLELREDEHGLWGSIEINPKDSDAMNAHARVERGDVNQCSIGMDILEEVTDYLEDGSVHWTIKSVKLYEVSICTFPAYEETSVEARKADYANIVKRKNEAWKDSMLKKLKGEQ